MTKVQFVTTHKHAGSVYHADDVLEVPDHDAAWLRDHGVVLTGNKTRRLKVVPNTSDEEQPK